MYKKSESVFQKAYNYFYPSYVSVDDLLKESPDLHIEPISQHSSYGKLPGYHGGICGGLSTQHILMQLQSKDADIKNPFSLEDNYSKSLELQRRRSNIEDRFNFPTVLETRLPAEEEIRKSVDVYSLHDCIEQSLAASQKDKHARGVLIFSQIRRNPYTGASLDSAHAFSMTIQCEDEKPVCTAFDSNIFFAKAVGKDACNKLKENLTNTVVAYNPTHTHLSVVKST